MNFANNLINQMLNTYTIKTLEFHRPILKIDDLQGVKCIIIASRIYKKVIYDRISCLEGKDIEIVQLYE